MSADNFMTFGTGVMAIGFGVLCVMVGIFLLRISR